MGAYILRRVLLMIPTMVGIMAISFLVVQFAPGGPVEQIIAQIQGTDVSATSRIGGGGGDFQGVPIPAAPAAARSPRAIAARRGSTPNSSTRSRSSSASTSRRSSASA